MNNIKINLNDLINQASVALYANNEEEIEDVLEKVKHLYNKSLGVDVLRTCSKYIFNHKLVKSDKLLTEFFNKILTF